MSANQKQRVPLSVFRVFHCGAKNIELNVDLNNARSLLPDLVTQAYTRLARGVK